VSVVKNVNILSRRIKLELSQMRMPTRESHKLDQKRGRLTCKRRG